MSRAGGAFTGAAEPEAAALPPVAGAVASAGAAAEPQSRAVAFNGGLQRSASMTKEASTKVGYPPEMRSPALLFLLALVACSPTAPVRTEKPEVAEATPFAGTLDAVEQPRPGAPVSILREVRAASQPGFDRVVFEFEGSAPGYRVEYVEPPVLQCGSGEAVAVEGEAWLQVRLTPAQAHTESGEATVIERERHLGLPILQEIESICDFEADVTWVLGVAARNPFRVQELPSPARLVIDIQHGHL
jgi:hypothetical protein